MAYLLGVGEEPMWYALLRREERGFGGWAEGDLTQRAQREEHGGHREERKEKAPASEGGRYKKKSTGVKASACILVPRRAQAGVPVPHGYLADLAFTWLKASVRRDL